MEKLKGDFWNWCYTERHLPFQSFILAKAVFCQQIMTIASPVELHDVQGQLDAICDCLDLNQVFKPLKDYSVQTRLPNISIKSMRFQNGKFRQAWLLYALSKQEPNPCCYHFQQHPPSLDVSLLLSGKTDDALT